MITSFRELVQRLLGVPSKHDVRPVNRTKFADGEVGRALRQQDPTVVAEARTERFCARRQSYSA